MESIHLSVAPLQQQPPKVIFGHARIVAAMVLMLFAAVSVHAQEFVEKTGAEAGSGFSFDPAKMIPLRDHQYRGQDFAVALTGSAIKGSQPIEVYMDTGSAPLCIPYGWVDKAQVKLLETNVKDVWGRLADKVQGQIAVMSTDGKTRYAVDDYVFWARKDPNGDDADEDRQARWPHAIMGAAPGQMGAIISFPRALALKYSARDAVGFGIVSRSSGNIDQNWATFKSYLQIGTNPQTTNRLHWRTDIPKIRGETFAMIPGFSIVLNFPHAGNQNVPDIVVPDLQATLDTGAPDLTMRLGPGNPHTSSTYNRFFTADGFTWRTGQYKDQSKCAVKDIGVRMGFTDSSGSAMHYLFSTSDDFKSRFANPSQTPPTFAIAGDWDGICPWQLRDPGFPPNRINLGSTLYYFCPVVFYDISHYRVGFADFE